MEQQLSSVVFRPPGVFKVKTIFTTGRLCAFLSELRHRLTVEKQWLVKDPQPQSRQRCHATWRSFFITRSLQSKKANLPYECPSRSSQSFLLHLVPWYTACDGREVPLKHSPCTPGTLLISREAPVQMFHLGGKLVFFL